MRGQAKDVAGGVGETWEAEVLVASGVDGGEMTNEENGAIGGFS